MKLSNETLTILKNFSVINPSLLFKVGADQETVSDGKEVLATARILEDITEEFAIYNLPEFLGLISTLGEPDLDIQDKFVVLSDGKIKLKYICCEKDLLTPIPTQKPTIKNPYAKFILTEKDLTKLLKIAGALSLAQLIVESKDGNISVRVENGDNTNTNSATFDIDVPSEKDFKATFNNALLKILPGDYEVTIGKNMAKLDGIKGVNYMIVMSNFEE